MVDKPATSWLPNSPAKPHGQISKLVPAWAATTMLDILNPNFGAAPCDCSAICLSASTELKQPSQNLGMLIMESM
jgi:hypothetical protein